MDWQEYASLLRQSEFQPTFASGQEQGYVVREARDIPSGSDAVWPHWQAHACPPYPSSAPQTWEPNALDPFGAQIIHFIQDTRLPYHPPTVHGVAALPLEESLPYHSRPLVHQKPSKRPRETQRPPRSSARETPVHHRIAKIEYPDLSQPPAQQKLRRGQFPPRDSTPKSNVTNANNASRQHVQQPPIQTKEIHSFQQEREYKRLKLEQRAPTETEAYRAGKRPRQHNASGAQAIRTSDAEQQPDIDARRDQHIETVQSPSHGSIDTTLNQRPLAKPINASQCEAIKESIIVEHTADFNSLSQIPEGTLSRSDLEEPDTAVVPALDLHDIYEIVIQSTIQLLASADADVNDDALQEGFAVKPEEVPSKEATISPLPSSLGELMNAPFGERPSYTWWELVRPIIVELKRLTGRASFAISEIVDVLQTKFLYFADPQVLDWTKKVLSQTLRHAKGVTQHIHYEGKAKRATWGCDESIDPRVRRAAGRTKDAMEAVDDKEEAGVAESEGSEAPAPVQSDSGKTLAIASKAPKKTEVKARASFTIERVTSETSDQPSVLKQEVIQQATERQAPVSDKGKTVNKEKKEKKAKRKEGRKGKPHKQKAIDSKPKADREAEVKAEAKHTGLSLDCQGCEWCGEGSK